MEDSVFKKIQFKGKGVVVEYTDLRTDEDGENYELKKRLDCPMAVSEGIEGLLQNLNIHVLRINNLVGFGSQGENVTDLTKKEVDKLRVLANDMCIVDVTFSGKNNSECKILAEFTNLTNNRVKLDTGKVNMYNQDEYKYANQLRATIEKLEESILGYMHTHDSFVQLDLFKDQEETK